MICPECGSYQPARAKFCGICGAPLSQEGLVESFLKDPGEQDIELPRHRSLLFYLAIGLIAVLVLAVLAGAGYLVYRVAWGEEKAEEGNVVIGDNTLEYADRELGFSFSYPNAWTLEEAVPADGELASLGVFLSSRKKMALRVYQLDPVVSIGGLEGIEEFLVEDASRRIVEMGGEAKPATPAGDAGGRADPTGYTRPQPGRDEPGGDTAAGGGEDGDGANGDLLMQLRFGDAPAFYTEFNANHMGEDTKWLLYYIVAGDYIFLFQGQAPSGEYPEVRPQYMAIAGSLRWTGGDEESPVEEGPGKGSPRAGASPGVPGEGAADALSATTPASGAQRRRAAHDMK